MYEDVEDKCLNSEKLNKQGHLMKVVHYGGCNDVTVQWHCGQTTKTSSANYSRGIVYYPGHKAVWGVGYIGFGTFINKLRKSNAAENRMKIPKLAQRKWIGMIARVHNPKYLQEDKNKGYLSCSIQESWYNFQEFCWWAINQKGYGLREDGGNFFSLDKDIVKFGNTAYSEGCCVFIPSEINKFFRSSQKGSYGSGVKPVVKKGVLQGYTSTISKFGEEEYLGYFDNPEDAESVYLENKRMVGVEMADKWKDILDERVIERLLTFNPVELSYSSNLGVGREPNRHKKMR